MANIAEKRISIEWEILLVIKQGSHHLSSNLSFRKSDVSKRKRKKQHTTLSLNNYATNLVLAIAACS